MAAVTSHETEPRIEELRRAFPYLVIAHLPIQRPMHIILTVKQPILRHPIIHIVSPLRGYPCHHGNAAKVNPQILVVIIVSCAPSGILAKPGAIRIEAWIRG